MNNHIILPLRLGFLNKTFRCSDHFYARAKSDLNRFFLSIHPFVTFHQLWTNMNIFDGTPFRLHGFPFFYTKARCMENYIFDKISNELFVWSLHHSLRLELDSHQPQSSFYHNHIMCGGAATLYSWALGFQPITRKNTNNTNKIGSNVCSTITRTGNK